jgi:hypothetical protein
MDDSGAPVGRASGKRVQFREARTRNTWEPTAMFTWTGPRVQITAKPRSASTEPDGATAVALRSSPAMTRLAQGVKCQLFPKKRLSPGRSASACNFASSRRASA